jgi:hypothetical protein
MADNAAGNRAQRATKMGNIDHLLNPVNRLLLIS